MHKLNPPFRAEQVGSFLRPAELKEARAKHERGEIDAALKAVEDKAIREVIRRRKTPGCRASPTANSAAPSGTTISCKGLDGVDSYLAEQGVQFKGAALKPIMLRVKDKLGFSNHPMIEHFRFVKEHTKRLAKMTIPSPTALHFRFGRQAVPASVYPRMEDFYRDLGAAYAKAVKAFADAGCTYLQLDEVYLAYLCDPEQREGLKSRGEDPETLPEPTPNSSTTRSRARPPA
jgi:5-methyltetrahydropteroyltriglutamate--homocysteine methyltransferase